MGKKRKGGCSPEISYCTEVIIAEVKGENVGCTSRDILGIDVSTVPRIQESTLLQMTEA
jgi:hypothetical protein